MIAKPSKPASRSKPANALSENERVEVLKQLTSAEYIDRSPYELYASKLDQGEYLCSIRSMYRILQSHKMTKERRRGHQQRTYKKPELLATGSNQVWSWDITKLKGPKKWQYYYLYVMLDIYSRYVVGYMVAERESASLATVFMEECLYKQQCEPGQLTIHADRGSSMRSKLVAQLLADLGITKTHSRPHVSNDNPFSESQFKTLKYCPSFPGQFGSIQDARGFCRPFFKWYNAEHRHTSLNLYTPEAIHYGEVNNLKAIRQAALEKAFKQHPERFRGKKPTAKGAPEAVWINPPETNTQSDEGVILINGNKLSQNA